MEKEELYQAEYERVFQLLKELYVDDVYRLDDESDIQFLKKDQKVVAEELGFGASQLSPFLKFHSTISRKNFITRLEERVKFRKTRDLNEEQEKIITQQKEELESKRQELNQLASARQRERSIYAAIFILFVFALFIFKSLRKSAFNQGENKEIVYQHDPAYQPNRNQLDILLSWHFDYLVSLINSEVLLFYADWECRNAYPEVDFNPEWMMLEDKVKQIMLNTLEQLKALNLRDPSGENIVELFEDFYDVDQLFSASIFPIKRFVRDSHLSTQTLSDSIITQINKISNIVLNALSPKLDSVYKAKIKATPNHLVTNPLELRRIMEWHGGIVIDNLVWEGIVLHEDLKTNSKKDIKLFLGEVADRIIASVIEPSRVTLKEIGFKTITGYRLDSLLVDALSYNEIRSTLINELADDLQNANISHRKLKDEIYRIARRLQEQSWDKMCEMAFEKNQPLCLISDRLKLRRIMEWHGKGVISNLTWQAILINEEYKNGEIKLTQQSKGDILQKIEDHVLKDVIEPRRRAIRDIGFETVTGHRLDSLLIDALSYQEMKKALVEELSGYLFEKEITSLKLKNEIDRVVRRIQERSWERMSKRIFPTE